MSLSYLERSGALKLGLAPTRRNLSRKGFFDKADAKAEKDLVIDMLRQKGIDYVDLSFLNDEGIIYNGLDADRAAQAFIDAKVDAVFVPHCNFGTEDAVARLAKKVNKPLLLWGPRDDAPNEDGYRLRDSQCGLFATSKVLQQFGVPFSYIPNSRVTDAVFQKGFDHFIAAACVVKAFRGARIGQIGTRPSAFWTVKCNEEELLHRFGIEVVPLCVPELKKRMDELRAGHAAEVRACADEMRRRIGQIAMSDESLLLSAAMKTAILNWAEEERLSAAAMLCNGAVRELLGCCSCFAMSELTDMGFPVACETDIHGALTSLMVQAAVRGSTATFLADMTVRHPENDNAELLWHCGVFPFSLRKPNAPASVGAHYGCHIDGASEWEIKGGDITVARFDGVGGDYRLLLAEGKGVEGPKNRGTYLWAEFPDWPKLETRLIRGPYIHHCTGVHGHVAAILYEACRYIPGLQPDAVDPNNDALENELIR